MNKRLRQIAFALLLMGTFIAFLRQFISTILGGDKDQPSPTATTYTLERSQIVSAPLSQVFPFFSNPGNLARITPDWLRFEIIEVVKLPLQVGTQIEYTVRPLGAPQRWVTTIIEYEEGRHFADLQAYGPYRYWRHDHFFEDLGTQTRIVDRVQYQMPLGPLGKMGQTLIVQRQLKGIFDHRQQVIGELFPESKSPA